MGNIPDYVYIIPDGTMKDRRELKFIGYAIKDLKKMEKAIKSKFFPIAKKELRNFVKTMKKAGYDYSKTAEELKEDIFAQKFKKDYSIAFKDAYSGNEKGIIYGIRRLKNDAKELKLDVSEKIANLEKICLEKNIQYVWEEIGTSLLQEDLDFKEIYYIEKAFPLLEKKVKKLEPERREFFEKQFAWVKKNFHEKAMIAYEQRSNGKKNNNYYIGAKMHRRAYAKEIGLDL